MHVDKLLLGIVLGWADVGLACGQTLLNFLVEESVCLAEAFGPLGEVGDVAALRGQWAKCLIALVA